MPTYVHVDSFTFVNNTGKYGSSSHNINSVFAIYNGINIGAFDLPCTIPVITSGYNQLILEPGIAVNGFNDQESPYPFYTDAIMDTLIPQPGKAINYAPQTGYTAATKLLMNADFEGGNNFSAAGEPGDDTENINITTVSSMVFEGRGSGLMNFTKNDSSESFFLNNLAIPISTPVLCEINYKSNIPIQVGLIPYSTLTGATTAPQYNSLAFAPSSEWTKVYINLAEIVSVFPADYYHLVIKAAVPAGQANGYALFDNIKVVTN